jgi:uncharacterized protein (TIGR01777 family)
MNVVVTGATGLVGRPLVGRLTTADHEVTVLSRDAARAASVLPARCVCHAWDPAGALDPAVLRGVDGVVHLAGEGVADGRWTPRRKSAIRESRVAGARAIVRAISALPAHERPRVLISASAIGYYGDRADELLDEQAWAGEGFLAEVCRAWEREVFQADALGLRTAAIRIGIVLAKQGGALRQMLVPFRLGVGGRVGSGRQWMSWIHLDDLVSLFLHVLEHPEAKGAINGVAPTPVTNVAFAAALGQVLHRPSLFPVPAVLLRVGLGEMSSILLASQRVVPRVAERLKFPYRYPELAGALANLCADSSQLLEREQWIARSPAELFRFFSDPYNLEKITPEFLRFRVVRTTTAELRAGTCINYRLALHGIPLRWQSRIESWEPHRRFVDVQTRGPYELWHHTHEFVPFRQGTIIRDRVRYALPFGALGELVAGRRVARDLEAIFEFRRRTIRELFP